MIAERQRVMAAQVALKRQQAAEDAIALGLRAISGEAVGMSFLPAGPVWGGYREGSDESNRSQNDPQITVVDDEDEDGLAMDSGKEKFSISIISKNRLYDNDK